MALYYAVVIILIFYLIRKMYRKRKIENLKNSVTQNFKQNFQSELDRLGVDDEFRKKHSKSLKKIDYEYNGVSFLEEMRNNSLNSFLATVERIKKNIEKGKIVPTNKGRLLNFINTTIPLKKEVKDIVNELNRNDLISLDQLEIIVENFKKYNRIFWEGEVNESYKSSYKDYELGLITKEEFEKRRRYYFGDNKN